MGTQGCRLGTRGVAGRVHGAAVRTGLTSASFCDWPLSRCASVCRNASQCAGVKPEGARTYRYGKKPCTCTMTLLPSAVVPNMRITAARASCVKVPVSSGITLSIV